MLQIGHTHHVLRQRSRLVGADDGCCPHGFTGMHLAHKVVGLEHTAHTVGKA